MRKNTRLTKRHVGLPVKFDAFDGRTYFGRLIGLRNRIASVLYDVTNDDGIVIRKDCAAYVEELNRISLA